MKEDFKLLQAGRDVLIGIELNLFGSGNFSGLAGNFFQSLEGDAKNPRALVIRVTFAVESFSHVLSRLNGKRLERVESSKARIRKDQREGRRTVVRRYRDYSKLAFRNHRDPSRVCDVGRV